MLDRSTGDAEAADHRIGIAARIGSNAENRTAAVLRHVPCSGGPGQEPSLHGADDWAGEAFICHVHPCITPWIAPIDCVEHQVYRVIRNGDSRQMLLKGLPNHCLY